MTDPQYVDKWPGLGRVTSLHFDYRVKVWVCSFCAAIVIDTERHTMWHRSLGVS